MSYSNGHITAPVSIYDVQRALGDSHNDIGNLCRSEKINVWARYRPIPCIGSKNNKVLPISDAQRQSERYGIDPPVDMFAADVIQRYEDYVNDAEFEKSGGYYVHLRPFGDTNWKRLTDFVKTDANGLAVAGKGYDHNAKCDDVVIVLNGKLYGITPLIPENQRMIYLQDGEVLRFQFPNDHIWVDEYYKYVKDDPLDPSDITQVYQNDEYLSSLDFMAFNTYGIDIFTSVVRSVVIFKWDAVNSEWKYLNRVNDTIYPLINDEDRPYDTYKNAWLDLTRHGGLDQYGDMDYSDTWQLNHPEYDTDDNASTCVEYFRENPYTTHIEEHHDELLRNLEGRLLFLEIWRQANSSTNIMPIQSLAYEVNIDRTQAPPPPPEPIHAFIENVFLYEYDGGSTSGEAIKITETTGPNYTGIEFTFYINPSNFLVDGQSFGYDTVANANLIMSRLRNFYSSLILRVGKINDVPLIFDMFMDIMEVVVEPYADPNWRKCTALMFEDNEHAVAFSDTTAEINAVIPQQLGEYKNGHDVLLVETSGF